MNFCYLKNGIGVSEKDVSLCRQRFQAEQGNLEFADFMTNEGYEIKNTEKEESEGLYPMIETAVDQINNGYSVNLDHKKDILEEFLQKNDGQAAAKAASPRLTEEAFLDSVFETDYLEQEQEQDLQAPFTTDTFLDSVFGPEKKETTKNSPLSKKMSHCSSLSSDSFETELASVIEEDTLEHTGTDFSSEREAPFIAAHTGDEGLSKLLQLEYKQTNMHPFESLMADHVKLTVKLLIALIKNDNSKKHTAMMDLFANKRDWLSEMAKKGVWPDMQKKWYKPVGEDGGLFWVHTMAVFKVFSGASINEDGDLVLSNKAKDKFEELEGRNAQDIAKYWTGILNLRDDFQKQFLKMWIGHIECTKQYAEAGLKSYKYQNNFSDRNFQNEVEKCIQQGKEIGKLIGTNFPRVELKNTVQSRVSPPKNTKIYFKNMS